MWIHTVNKRTEPIILLTFVVVFLCCIYLRIHLCYHIQSTHAFHVVLFIHLIVQWLFLLDTDEHLCFILKTKSAGKSSHICIEGTSPQCSHVPWVTHGRHEVSSVHQLRPREHAVAEWVRALHGLHWRPDGAGGFVSHCGQLRFETLAIPFTPLCHSVFRRRR